jgi:hypothetical protein
MDPRFRFTGVLIGSALCVSLLLVFGLLGTAIGLFYLDLKSGLNVSAPEKIGGVAFLFVGIAASFLLGALACAKWERLRDRRLGAFHGVALWGTVVSVLALFYGTQLLSSFGSLAGVAASPAGLNAMAEEWVRLNPRIVSDIDLGKGHIVSSLAVDGPKQGIGSRLGKRVQSETKDLADKQLADDGVRKAAASIGLLAVGALLLSALASAAGGALGSASPPPARAFGITAQEAA